MKTTVKIMTLMAVVFTVIATPVFAQEEETLGDKAKDKAADGALWVLEKTTGIDIEREDIETGSNFLDFLGGYSNSPHLILVGYSTVYSLVLISLLLLAFVLKRPRPPTGKGRSAKVIVFFFTRFLIVRVIVFGLEVAVEFGNWDLPIQWFMLAAPVPATLFLMKGTWLNGEWWSAVFMLMKQKRFKEAFLLDSDNLDEVDDELGSTPGQSPTGTYVCPHCGAQRNAKFCSNAACPGPSGASQVPPIPPQQPHTPPQSPIQPTASHRPAAQRPLSTRGNYGGRKRGKKLGW